MVQLWGLTRHICHYTHRISSGIVYNALCRLILVNKQPNNHHTNKHQSTHQLPHSKTLFCPKCILFTLEINVIFRIKFTMECFCMEKKLGEGGYGDAYLVKSKDSGILYVMKKIKLHSVRCSWELFLPTWRTLVRGNSPLDRGQYTAVFPRQIMPFWYIICVRREKSA